MTNIKTLLTCAALVTLTSFSAQAQDDASSYIQGYDNGYEGISNPPSPLSASPYSQGYNSGVADADEDEYLELQHQQEQFNQNNNPQ